MKKVQCIRGTNNCRKVQHTSFFSPKHNDQSHAIDPLTLEEGRQPDFFEPAPRYQMSKTGLDKSQEKNEKQGKESQASGQAISHVMKTSCDVKTDRRDYIKVLMKGSFRMEGTGKPQIEVLSPELQKTNPCLMEVAKLHEDQHVQNSLKNCQDYKRCVDDKSWSVIGDPTISYEDYVMCHNKHHGGFAEDCIADENTAYEKSIAKAKQLLMEVRCGKEKEMLKKNIAYWERIKAAAPNCKKNKK